MTKKQLKYIAKWVELLKSGKFKQDQTKGVIQDSKGCLGAILGRAMLLENGYKTNFEENIGKLPMEEFGIIGDLPTEVISNFLIDRNNQGAWSFSKMANYLTDKYL